MVRIVISVSISAVLLASLAAPLSAKKKKKASEEEGMNLEVSTKQKKKKSDEEIGAIEGELEQLDQIEAFMLAK